MMIDAKKQETSEAGRFPFFDDSLSNVVHYHLKS